MAENRRRAESQLRAVTGQTELAEQAMEEEHRTQPAEPVSPELALIDPDLARRQRAKLPDPQEIGRDRQAAIAAGGPDVLAKRTAVATEARHEPAPSRSTARKLLKRGAVLVVLASAALAGVGAASIWPGRGEQPRLLPRAVNTSDGSVEQPRGSRPTHTSSGRAGSATGEARSPKRETPRRSADSRSAQSTRKPVATEPKTFAWVAVPRATYYSVEFYRGRQRILQAFPVRPRLVVPATWSYRGKRFSFAPGTYRWTVRPGFGRRNRGRYGAPVVASTWVLKD
jgi:hypothetical protein